MNDTTATSSHHRSAKRSVLATGLAFTISIAGLLTANSATASTVRCLRCRPTAETVQHHRVPGPWIGR